MHYVGIDVHANSLRVTVLNEDGHHVSHRFDNTTQGRAAMLAHVSTDKVVAALGAAPETTDLKDFLSAKVERVLVVKPDDLFHLFPKDVGKKTLNLARLAHRVAHEANVDRLLTQSAAEIRRLVAHKRESVRALVAAHVPPSQTWPADLWNEDGQAWLEQRMSDLPSKAQQTCMAEYRLIHELSRDLAEMEQLSQ
jgi:hypothetical protein